ncbi:uncharacterized protein LOC132555748 [Ylistrum balloti]|uniref:uncharacterized protein LOC132555748 n=1 Tax=Ylistrum balloti TaxID=509963 RepID=UPI002905E588|nr:uncharacterized protein LOC132555748 [Ylistrum balloti]
MNDVTEKSYLPIQQSVFDTGHFDDSVRNIPVSFRRFQISLSKMLPAKLGSPGPATSTTCSHRCDTTGQSIAHTCSDAFAQIIPACVYETDPAGTCILSLTTNASLTFDVTISHPFELVNRLDGYFRFNRNNTDEILELQQTLDVETVYLNTNITTLEIQLKVSCKNHFQTMENAMLNLTIIDDDDNSPSFGQEAAGTCVLPVFTASAHEQYIGPLTTKPSCICATDGDFITNNDITLSFLHGNPQDFSKFFAVDLITNTINKTSHTSSDDPTEFTFIIEATEQSAQGRSMVAVLSVGIESGYPAVVTTVHKANDSVKLVLQALSAIILAGFTVGFVILIWHRNKRVKPMTEVKDAKSSVIACFTSNGINETARPENNSQCTKQTEWTLEAIDEEPELMSM